MKEMESQAEKDIKETLTKKACPDPTVLNAKRVSENNKSFKNTAKYGFWLQK